ncbi:MAG: FtsX-like permease family protein [Bacteroidales bacterium]|nr:FtsX-like permease family protein [Bacteroidales bacterium]
MKLPLLIASRYLFAKKSHNVINIVSAISCVGMAVGTAALIIILSVYNGFDALVKTMMSSVEPDLMIVPAQGKFFVPEGDAYAWAQDCPDIDYMCTVLQDNVFVSYDGKQTTALVKGVDEIYQQNSILNDYVCDGNFTLVIGERNYAAMGRSLASSLGLDIRFIAPLLLYFPQKDARISLLNPLASLHEERLWPCCEFAVNQDIDSKLIVVDQQVMRRLLSKEDEVSAVEIRLSEGTSARRMGKIKKELQSRLSDGFRVLDRAQQNPSLYKMLVYEKAAVYLIMLFVVLILGFSIFGSLSMLIMDKSDDIDILKSMGMTLPDVRRIFCMEGWFITLLGMFAGLVAGVALCLAQEHFGLVSMPDNFIVDSYPVVLAWADVAFSALSIAVIGYFIALVPSKRIK